MKMSILILFCVIVGAYVTTAREIYVQNNLGYTIYVGILGNSGQPTPENGGFELGAGQRRTVGVPDNWAGRLWGRTGCNFNGNSGHCETGDCGNTLQCSGRGGAPPATLAEIKFQGANGQDYYDVSLVDGFNLPMTFRPTDQGGSGRHCTAAGCSRDLNPGCPGNLQQRSGNRVVGCKSSCVVTNSDRDCCRGGFNNAGACGRSQSAQYFKENCRDAYSFAYDDATSTFTCQNTNYEVKFGG